MPILASAVGEKLAEREVEISTRQLLAYAAGVGETAESHFDDARPGGCRGVPAFCVSLEWPIVRASASESPLGASPSEILRGVHASQDSTFHRPIRAGDRLRTTGRVASIQSTRAGALVMNKIVTVEISSNAPVVTSWYGSIFRGVEVEGVKEPLEVPPELPPDVPAGAATEGKLTRVLIPITREAPHLYSECADIWNPIHTEREVALAAGLPDIILHGTATWALAAREIVRHHCNGDSRRLRRLHGRFAAMVIPGTEIEVEMAGLEAGTVTFGVRNSEGQLALQRGMAQLA